jgi:hypothetical protein
VGDDSVSTRQAAVKKYVVTLSAEEREWLEALIRTGKHSARKLLRARILLKADASEAGEALTDSQIARSLSRRHRIVPTQPMAVDSKKPVTVNDEGY